jgi:uncharacterized OB-fold protein
MTLAGPAETERTRPFWDATREGRLVLPWCPACEAFFWYPRPVCPTCLAETVEWRPAAGTGEVHAVSVQYRAGPGRDGSDGPYAVAVVELAEGVRMLSNIVGVPPEEVAVVAPVRLSWHELSDGRRLPMFTPV